jgi:hypothetical protein
LVLLSEHAPLDCAIDKAKVCVPWPWPGLPLAPRHGTARSDGTLAVGVTLAMGVVFPARNTS